MSDNSTLSFIEVLTQNWVATVASVGSVLAAIGAFFATLFARQSAKLAEKANIGSTMLACLERYTAVMADKRNAVKKHDILLAKQFYRELFDLHWSEMYLWKDGIISDSTMLYWLKVRKRNYDNDRISVKTKDLDKVQEVDVSYKDYWNEINNTRYFERDDPFVKLMEEVHDGKIMNIESLVKYKKKHFGK